MVSSKRRQVDSSKLSSFADAAAGHEGVLTDESGDLVVKPATADELAFYEETIAHHHDFAALIPTFYGTVQLGASKAATDALATSSSQPYGADSAAADTPPPAATALAANGERLKGKAIETETAVVLQNVAAGFVRPNVLDVKLGAQLWDHKAAVAKRQKLDKVAAETTSKPLGFRVAGMKLWKGDDYRVYDKFYGRERTVGNVHEAFEEFFDVAGSEPDTEAFADVHPGALEAVEEIERVVAGQESRMYSASLLFVYEGDREARKKAIEAAKEELNAEAENGADGEDEDDDEGDNRPRLFDVRLIDFAHATWTPGAGPDENMLHGIREVVKIIKAMS